MASWFPIVKFQDFFTSYPLVSSKISSERARSAGVVLGFSVWTGRYPPNDDSDFKAGVAGWALSLHGAKLLKVTDKK